MGHTLNFLRWVDVILTLLLKNENGIMFKLSSFDLKE